MRRADGFTVVELIVTMVIMTILASIVVVVPSQFMPASRDSERGDDATSLARRLEQAYNAQELGAPSYPSTTQLATDIAAGNGSVSRLPQEALRAPGASNSSVASATSNSATTPLGAGSPVLNEYVYQPLTNANALCTGSATCIRFVIYYRLERTNAVQAIKSIHQQ